MQILDEKGATISKKNKTLLRQAMEALQSLLGSEIATEDDGETVNEAKRLDVLSEGAIRQDGTIGIKIIQAGWGSSGYYSPEVLQAAAPLFGAGVHMYANHPSMSEQYNQPERRIQELAGVLIAPATWDERDQALYAQAKIFEDWQGLVEDKAASIGVSIRAMGRSVSGEVAGKAGEIIQQITEVLSVDFVTKAGAGGRIALLESAKTTNTEETTTMAEDESKLRLESVIAELNQVRSELERMRTQQLVDGFIAESGLPLPAQNRLKTATRSVTITMAEAEKVAKQMIEAERSYLSEVAPSQSLQGFGSMTQNADDGAKALYETYRANGLSDKAAKLASGWEG